MSALGQRPLQRLLRGLWLATLLLPFAPALLQSGTGVLPPWHGVPVRWGLALLYILLILLAWPIFQQATTRSQILWLGCIGSVLLLLRSLQPGGGIAPALALVAYVAEGLGLLGLHEGRSVESGRSGPALPVVGALLLGLMALGAASSAWTAVRLPPHQVGLLSGGAGPGAPVATPPDSSRDSDPLNRISMSRPVSLADTPILTITGAPAATYWAMATYDHFDGRAWTAPAAGRQSVAPDAGQPLLPPAVTGFPVQEWQVTFQRLTADRLPLIYAGTPVAFADPGGGAGSGGVSVAAGGAAALSVQPALRALWAPGITDYTLRLRIPLFDAGALLQAPYAPPAAELQSDLALPSDLSPAVAALAQEAAGDAATPWQTVRSVANYLRTHETYTTQFSLPGGDVVNAFLLDGHQGYCDQFATSFIMLMRTLSIPARWVMGYRVGPDDLASNQYIVRARNAHSWAEVYVAPYGWIPVDPTPGGDLPESVAAGGALAPQPPGTSGTPGNLPPASPPEGPAAPARSPSALSAWALAVAGLTLLALVGALVLWLRRRGRGDAARRSTQTLWRELARLAERQALAAPAGPPVLAAPNAPMTPRELLAKLPAEQQAALVPVVQLLERAWYSAEPLPAAEIAAALSMLRARAVSRP